MTFQISAPFPSIVTTTLLPNPTFGDGEGATGELNIIRSVNGKRRTYIKSKNGRRKLNWTFRLTRNKAIELLEFFRSYHGNRIYVKDHNDRTWEGYFITNPFETTSEGAAKPAVQNWPTGERWTVELEFEGFRTNLDARAARTFSLAASSVMSLSVTPSVETSLPTNNLLHNWDASNIAGAMNGQRLYTWPDLGSAGINLESVIGGSFDPTIDRAPTYVVNSINGRPTVLFDTVLSATSSNVAAMKTVSNTTIFPSRRGTIFWIMQHTIDTNMLGASATEYGVWSQGNPSINDRVEQVHFSGGSNPLMPVNIRFNPADTTNELRIATSASNVIPGFTPFIMMLQRNSDTTLRFRVNGVEYEGATILNNTPVNGIFRVNDQQWKPEFDSKITANWGQILIYNNAIDNTVINNVEQYLANKWGVVLGTEIF